MTRPSIHHVYQLTTRSDCLQSGNTTTVTIDELYLILEMTLLQSGDKLQKKIYHNTFKILEENASNVKGPSVLIAVD